ncbi:MAG: xanthine dehydrogenase accessory protein XdhC [Geminicoccaceae bacterium]
MGTRLASELRRRHEPAVLVTVVEARGSTPREAGVRMVVSAAEVQGTIGGGRLEWDAIRRARELLGTGEPEAEMAVPLGPAVGQCCGGHVHLHLERVTPAVVAAVEAVERAELQRRQPVLLFGAGHVGQAVATALAPLPFAVRWIDGRAEAFPASAPENATVVVSTRQVAEVEAAPAGAACLVLTHSHALDFEICAAALERGDFAYIGLIGSATKRARFERGFRELGIAGERIAGLVCPIGSRAVRDKRPEVIAALVAAELLTTLAAVPARTSKLAEVG